MELFQGVGDGLALFVLFNSYGSPGRNAAELNTGTPPIFCSAQRISLQQESYDDDDNDDGNPIPILLDNEEAHDLLSRLLLSQPTQQTLANDLMNYVISISGGHAGALAGLLETIILDPVSIHFLVADNFLVPNNFFVRLHWRNALEMDQSFQSAYLILSKFSKAIPHQNGFGKELSTKGLREGFH